MYILGTEGARDVRARASTCNPCFLGNAYLCMPILSWYLYCEWYHHKCPYVLDAILDQLLSLLQKNLKTPPVRIELTMLSSNKDPGAITNTP